MNWRNEAHCRFSDPELFFPVGTTGPALYQAATALSICDSCVVKLDCLEDAMVNWSEDGIRGGTTADERRKLARERVTNGRNTSAVRLGGTKLAVVTPATR